MKSNIDPFLLTLIYQFTESLMVSFVVKMMHARLDKLKLYFRTACRITWLVHYFP